MKSLTLNISVAILCMWVTSAHAEESSFSDNYVEYRYGTAFKEPGVNGGKDLEKSIINLTHFNSDSLGSNYLSADFLFSNGDDPKENSTHGATEAYVVFRRDWSAHKILGMEFPAGGAIRDIALHMGGDVNAKNTAFEPRKKLLVIGPEVQFAVPSGYFNLAFNYSQEWNHNGIVGKEVSFNPAPQVEAVWGIPLHLYGTTWNFTGFLVYVGPKGRDGFGKQTRAEILTRPELLLDVGELFGKSHVLEMGAGYEYWLNKFGNNHTEVPGALSKTPMFIVKVHL